jgi:hypothetical protein
VQYHAPFPVVETFAVTVFVTPVSCSDSCNGGVSLSVTGGEGPYAVDLAGSADTALTGLCTGFYTIIVSDVNGCLFEDTAAVAVPVLTVVIAGSDTAFLNDTVVYNTPAYPGMQYSWSATGGTVTSGQGSNQVNIVWTDSGLSLLVLTVSDSTGCLTASDSMTVYNAVPLTKAVVAMAFPNPAAGNVALLVSSQSAGGALLRVIAVDGKIVAEQFIRLSAGTSIHHLDIERTYAGVYILELAAHGSVVRSLLIVK